MAYVADGPGGLVVLNVSNPTNLIVVTNLPVPGGADSLDITNGIAYVANNSGNLFVFDVSLPTPPIELGNYQNSFFSAQKIRVVGTRGYLVDYYSGITVLDVSNPTNLVELATLDLIGVLDIQVANNIAYLAAGADGLRILDMSNPGAPIYFALLQLKVSLSAYTSLITLFMFQGVKTWRFLMLAICRLPD